MSSAESPNLNSPKTPARKSSQARSSASSSSRSLGQKSTHRSYPSSKLTGVLKELNEDIVANSLKISNSSFSKEEKPVTIYGKDEIYVENHGKFVKAPKEILFESEYKRTTLYHEETWKANILSPLDLVIMLQRLWSLVGKVFLGILSGLAVTEIILVLIYLTNYEGKHFFEYYTVYSIITSILDSVYYILFIFSIISLLDWLDLAHADLRHIADTLRYRKVWIIVVMYLIAMMILFSTTGINELISSKYELYKLDETKKMEIERNEELISAIKQWNAASLAKNIIIVLGWIGLVCINHEDSFLLHLIEIKKYDYPEDHLAVQMENHI